MKPRLQKRNSLDVAQQLMLFRLKLRQNFTYRMLAILFHVSLETCRLIFWDVCCANYTQCMETSSKWCRHDLSDESKNQMYGQIAAKDELLRRTLARFKDPRGLNRLPVAISIDSTRLKCQKSSFVPLQKSTYYVECDSTLYRIFAEHENILDFLVEVRERGWIGYRVVWWQNCYCLTSTSNQPSTAS